MKITKLFTKTSKQYPKDEISISSQLLSRAGYIDKVSAGVYSLLPLGLKAATKIINIIREEMDKIGGQELLLPGLVPKNMLEQTGRWMSFDALFKLKGVDGKEYALGATHEEIVSPLVKKYILSYKDLPFALYQIQDKFRNEVRAKSGVLRTREFLMKDLYSFHPDTKDLDRYYEQVKDAYWKIFERCGIKDKTYYTFASGGDFTKYSHEFQSETEAGEDEIYVCKKCSTALNRDILDKTFECPECKGKEYEVKKAIEVGNIFKLGTRFSTPFNLNFVDEKGKQQPVIIGCYGIGIQRLLGTIAEVYHDQKGIMWPKSVAPYPAHLIALDGAGAKADRVYEELLAKDIEVLYDDREASAGEKFADADLIGLPYRLLVSEKTGEKIELKARESEQAELVEGKELIRKIR